MDFKGMSTEMLEQIAENAAKLAKQLRAEEPSYDLALANGVHDESYNTVRFGKVSSYSGKAEIVMENGTRWVAEGHKPTGGADWIGREGFIEFTKIEDAPPKIKEAVENIA